MHLKLADIAEIQSGYHFPEGVTFDAQAEYRVIQPKDISPEGKIRPAETPVHTPKPPHEGHLVKPSDILFISRLNPRAAYVEKPIPHTIATSHFFIIRAHGEKALPAYLAWFLNQKSTQSIVRKVAQGTSIVNVTKKDLMNLDVLLPPKEMQAKVAKLDQLSRNYKAIHEELQLTLDKMIEALTNKAIQKYEKGALL